MQALFVDPGALRIEMTLESCATVQDVTGGLVEAWSETATVFARIEPVTATSVFGADQTLEFEGGLYDKAESLEAARARLKLLRGKPHQLHSAVVVARDGQPIWREVATCTLTMRDFSDDFLEAYLIAEGEEALGSVGCHRLESHGAQLFSKIEGDYFAILGLPLLGLLDLLRKHGALAA